MREEPSFVTLNPTRRNIQNQFRRLARKTTRSTVAPDGSFRPRVTEVWVYYVGHSNASLGLSTQETGNRDVVGKEKNSRYRSTLVPTDYRRRGFVTDTFLRKNFVEKLNPNSRCVALFDSPYQNSPLDLEFRAVPSSNTTSVIETDITKVKSKGIKGPIKKQKLAQNKNKVKANKKQPNGSRSQLNNRRRRRINLTSRRIKPRNATRCARVICISPSAMRVQRFPENIQPISSNQTFDFFNIVTPMFTHLDAKFNTLTEEEKRKFRTDQVLENGLQSPYVQGVTLGLRRWHYRLTVVRLLDELLRQFNFYHVHDNIIVTSTRRINNSTNFSIFPETAAQNAGNFFAIAIRNIDGV